METKTASKFKRKSISQNSFGNRTKTKNCFERQFRLSDLDVTNHFTDLPNSNSLLFQLNEIYNPTFNPNKLIQSHLLSDELLKGLQSTFNTNPLHFGIADDYVLVAEELKYDVYQFELKPFFKLRYKAPILFDAFMYFVHSSKIEIIDNKNTKFFDEYVNEIFMDKATDTSETLTERKSFLKAIESIKISEKIIKNSKSKKTKKTILKELANYKPHNKTYILLKECLLNWLELDFSFINNYPYDYYTKEEKNTYEDDEDDENDDSIDLSDVIVFAYNDNQHVTAEINEMRTLVFNNSKGISPPCWLITKEKAETNIKIQIEKFETFATEYLALTDLMNVI